MDVGSFAQPSFYKNHSPTLPSTLASKRINLEISFVSAKTHGTLLMLLK